MNLVERYIEIWDQLRPLPISERPVELKIEFEDIWKKMTREDKKQLDKFFEERS